ncbi:MAG: D-2-hydroxyacid dehydrogenase [Candidatus Rokubacteria bacterium]|nr:D-2-hydroxyacid dehydrogenase [Candidatus Rokubacteria bacterium]
MLVYYPDAEQVARYAGLVRAPRARVTLHVASDLEQALAVIADTDVLYAWKSPASLYPHAARLAWLQVMGAGVDWAFVPELPERVTVTRAPGVFGPWMAEYVLAWVLWVTQRGAHYQTAQRERRWSDEIMPERLGGKTLAIVGLGEIGHTIARYARSCGMRVVGASRSGRPVPGVERVVRVASLHRVLGMADFVVLTVPLTAETRGTIGDRALAAMRPTAWLVNIARGPVVDERALVAALEARRIGGAILDVFDEEPLPPDHPLWALPNVVITPHVAGPSTPEELTPIFNENLARWLAGRPLHHVVDRGRGY